MVFAWLRTIAKGAKSKVEDDRLLSPLPFKGLRWMLRAELGESTGREHFHLLITGLPLERVNIVECFWQMSAWERLGGGMARVRVYEAQLPGAQYVLKGLEQPSSDGANAYELTKFGERET
jgi:hypothetical protein